MTFISFDDNGRRLITGSRYGEIKVSYCWCQSSHHSWCRFGVILMESVYMKCTHLEALK